MRTNKKLAAEKLERREVFSVAPGFEGLAPDTIEPPQVTDQEIIDALNNGTQLTAEHRRLDASGLNRDGGVSIFDFPVFASQDKMTNFEVQDLMSRVTVPPNETICILHLDAASVDDVFASRPERLVAEEFVWPC